MTRTAIPPARFRDLLVAEWIKLWSLRSTYAVLGGGALVIVALTLHGTLADYRLMPGWSAEKLAIYNWLHDAFGRTPYVLLMLAAASVGAVTMTGEHGTGLIRTTFAAVPARREVVLAKAAVLAGVTTLAGTVIATVSFGVSQAILDRRGGGFSATDPGVLTGIAGAALIPAACALVGLGVGALVRHSAGAVFAVIAVLLLLPEVTKGRTYPWVAGIDEAQLLSAFDTLRNTPFRYIDGGDPFGMPPLAAAWLTLAAWPVAAVAIAVLAVNRRDV